MVTTKLRRLAIGLVVPLWQSAALADEQDASPPSSASDTSGLRAAPEAMTGAAVPDGSDADEAKRAFADGLVALRDERWPDAEAAFRRSLGLVKRSSTLYDLAFVLYMEKRPRECLALLEDLDGRGDEAGDARYRQYGALLVPRVMAELSTLRFVVAPRGAAVRIDGESPRDNGKELALEVLPGRHDVEVTAPGYVSKRMYLVARAGTDVEREIELEPIAAESRGAPHRADGSAAAGSSPSKFSSVAPWVTVGLGGALLVGAAVTGALALDTDAQLSQACPTNRNCDPSLRGTQDRALGLGHAADVLLLSGAVLVAGGLTWHFLVPSPRSAAQSRAVFVGVSGAY